MKYIEELISMRSGFTWLAAAGILTFAARGVMKADTNGKSLKPPDPPREFRGVWLATVANIDWPSKPGLPVAQQQSELIAILDRASHLNLNAVIFQVRPACDAMY